MVGSMVKAIHAKSSIWSVRHQYLKVSTGVLRIRPQPSLHARPFANIASGHNQQEKSGRPKPKIISPLFGSVYVPSPALTSPRDVLSHFPTISEPDIPTPLLVLLLTPSLLSWLNDDQTFVRDALSRIFRGTKSAHKFHVLTAVVDRLPSPSTKSWSSSPQRLGHLENLSLKNGREGVAFLVGESARMAPDLWSARRKKVETDTMTVQQRSTISFQLRPKKRVRSFANPGLVPRPYVSHEIELPLANTIFLNGRNSTMSASRWSRAKATQEMRVIIMNNCAPQNQRILMSINAGNGPNKAQFLKAPLLTLTVPRIIASAMGNIIRQLYADLNAPGTVPASEGLERAVTEYFERRGRSPQQVAVWALVTPKEKWIGEPTVRGVSLLSRIEQGSRLHRVLSGGGGYGKKQGLLSLDPDAAYDLRSRTSPFGTGEDLDQEAKDALGQVAKPGDVIQFFIYPPDIGPMSGGGDHPKIKYQSQFGDSKLQHFEIQFGTIPSTIDSMPSSATEVRKQRGGSNTEYSKDHFGALSEQGLSLTIDTHGPEGMDYIGAERVGRVVQTKLDVPFTSFASAYIIRQGSGVVRKS